MKGKSDKVLSIQSASERVVAPGRLKNNYGIDVLPGTGRVWGEFPEDVLNNDVEVCKKRRVLKVYSLNMTRESIDADYDNEEAPGGRNRDIGRCLQGCPVDELYFEDRELLH